MADSKELSKSDMLVIGLWFALWILVYTGDVTEREATIGTVGLFVGYFSGFQKPATS